MIERKSSQPLGGDGFSCLVRNRGSDTTRRRPLSRPPASPLTSASTLHERTPAGAPSSCRSGRDPAAAACLRLPDLWALLEGCRPRCICLHQNKSNPTIHVLQPSHGQGSGDRQDTCSRTSASRSSQGMWVSQEALSLSKGRPPRAAAGQSGSSLQDCSE